MAMAMPLIGELVLDGAEALEAGGVGNIVSGVEAGMKTFKDEIIKGSIFGLGESGAFIAGEKIYDKVKDDLGIVDTSKQPIKKRHHKRKV